MRMRMTARTMVQTTVQAMVQTTAQVTVQTTAQAREGERDLQRSDHGS